MARPPPRRKEANIETREPVLARLYRWEEPRWHGAASPPVGVSRPENALSFLTNTTQAARGRCQQKERGRRKPDARTIRALHASD